MLQLSATGVRSDPVAFEGIRGDIAMYRTSTSDGRWYTKSGFWVAATYRVGAYAQALKSRPLRLGLLAVHRALATPWRVVKGVHIPTTARIGPGLRLPHPQNIILPPDLLLGEDCSIYQDVTVGRGPTPGVPSIGARVILYPGSRILGGLTIGDDARIGANAVVTRDVPAEALVSAPASRIIPRETAERMGRPTAPRRADEGTMPPGAKTDRPGGG